MRFTGLHSHPHAKHSAQSNTNRRIIRRDFVTCTDRIIFSYKAHVQRTVIIFSLRVCVQSLARWPRDHGARSQENQSKSTSCSFHSRVRAQQRRLTCDYRSGVEVKWIMRQLYDFGSVQIKRKYRELREKNSSQECGKRKDAQADDAADAKFSFVSSKRWVQCRARFRQTAPS